MSKTMEMLESCQQSTDSRTVLVEDRVNNFEGEVHYLQGDYWKKADNLIKRLIVMQYITWKSPNHLGIMAFLPSNLVNTHLLSTPV